MKRLFGFSVTAALALCLVCFAACTDDVSSNVSNQPGKFTTAPVVTLTAENGRLKVSWTDSVPKADSYDIYYIKGTYNAVQKVKTGEKLTQKQSGERISGLTNGDTYSVLVTANKSKTSSIDSAAVQLAPGGGNHTSNGNDNNNGGDDGDGDGDGDGNEGNGNEGNGNEGNGNEGNGNEGNGNEGNGNEGNGNEGNGNEGNGNEGNGNPVEPNKPVLALRSIPGAIICTWTQITPPADSFDLYYYDEGGLSAGVLKTGSKVANVTSPYTLTNLRNGGTYSVLITANRGGSAIDSAVMEGRPNAENKRGVGYDFTTARVGSKNYTFNTGRDMDLLMGGLHGIKWFYSWGVQPNAAVVSAMASRNLAFFPMVWNNNYTETAVRTAVNSIQPRPEYILAFNEPNFRRQSNMTPAQAAAAWPKLKSLANELNLKIVSPAMNFSPDAPYEDPTKWLDEFFALVPASDVAAISIHSYAAWPSALKSHVEGYKKYGKPIWVTEFSAWEDNANPTGSTINSWEKQNEYLSQAITYLELDPGVERYAWYIPKGHMADNVPPFQNLLTDVAPNNTEQSQLTQLGIIYTNLSTCDKTVWIPAGQKIDASQYTSCNLADHIDKTTFSDSVLSRPVTDTDKSAGVLEIYRFGRNMWVEYQVNLPQTKNYTLTIRYNTAITTGLYSMVDGENKEGKALNTAGAWDNYTFNLGNIEEGKHTIRLRVTNAGACALNWLQVD